jgi:hypothetical protein
MSSQLYQHDFTIIETLELENNMLPVSCKENIFRGNIGPSDPITYAGLNRP